MEDQRMANELPATPYMVTPTSLPGPDMVGDLPLDKLGSLSGAPEGQWRRRSATWATRVTGIRCTPS